MSKKFRFTEKILEKTSFTSTAATASGIKFKKIRQYVTSNKFSAFEQSLQISTSAVDA